MHSEDEKRIFQRVRAENKKKNGNLIVEAINKIGCSYMNERHCLLMLIVLVVCFEKNVECNGWDGNDDGDAKVIRPIRRNCTQNTQLSIQIHIASSSTRYIPYKPKATEPNDDDDENVHCTDCIKPYTKTTRKREKKKMLWRKTIRSNLLWNWRAFVARNGKIEKKKNGKIGKIK